MWVLALG
jgi:hypothetical protein